MSRKELFAALFLSHLLLDEFGRDVGETPHRVDVACIERAVYSSTKTAKGSVDTAVAQSNRDTEEGANRHSRSRRKLARFSKLHGVLDQLRQTTIDNALAIAVLQWIRTANSDRDIATKRIDVAKDASTIFEL